MTQPLTVDLAERAVLPNLDRDSEEWLNNSGAVISALHRIGRVARGTHGLELISYESVKRVLHDREFTTAVGEALRIDVMPKNVEVFLRDGLLPGIGGERHRRIRRVLMSAFGARSVDQQRRSIQVIANSLIDAFIEDGSADLVRQFTTRFPIEVVSRLIGVPVEDISVFGDWTLAMGHLADHPIGSGYGTAEVGMSNMAEYLRSLVQSRKHTPRDDLVTAIVDAQYTEGLLTEDEMIYNLMNLLMAGQDTTRLQLANGLYLFSQNPDDWAALCANPSLALNSVDEAMRLVPSVRRTYRSPQMDMIVDGVQFVNGEVIVANLEAANLDPRVFTAPEKFDIRRTNSKDHLTFGHGAHFCLGAALSRTAQSEALVLLSKRIPDFELAKPPVLISTAATFGGPNSLEVSFTPRKVVSA